MSTVEGHYSALLADVYSWMMGGFDVAVEKYATFFNELHLHPQASGIALDLGAGCGFQSIPLARLGYSVTAIDLDEMLLTELRDHAKDLSINTHRSDLLKFDELGISNVELIICMTDTLTHLQSSNDIIALFSKVYQALEKGGSLILSFRDLTAELSGVDRFIPVRSDEQRIFTCFLEYESDTVKVHDILYTNENGQWQLSKSFYRKLRLSEQWTVDHLEGAGFSLIKSTSDQGMITIIATK